MTLKPQPGIRRRWIQRLLLVGLGTLLGWGCAEGVLVVFGISYPLPYAPDEFCAVRLQPGFSGYWSKEGGAHFVINSAGFRDRDHTVPKPRDTIRIAVLGDSYIEALQVAFDQTFGQVLERELNHPPLAPGTTTEVLSFGVSGWGTAQELLALREHVLQFEPDFVVLAFLPANDVRNNSRELESNRCRPFFHIENDELVPDFSFRRDPVYVNSLKPITRMKTSLINSSRVLQMLYATKSGFAERRTHGDSAAEAGLDESIFAEPATKAWKDAWSLTDRLIEQIHHELREREIQFAVMVIPSSQQVHWDNEVRRHIADRLNVADLDYAERHIAALADKNGFSAILLARPLRDWSESHQTFIHGFRNTAPGTGHWNEHGHREAARIAATDLRRIGSPTHP